MSTITVTNIKATGETASRSATGVAAAWCNWKGDGTAAILDSLNVSSLTDNGTGDYTFAYTNNFSSVNYTIAGCFCYSGVVNTFVYNVQPKQQSDMTASSSGLVTVFVGASSSGAGDYPYAAFQAQGDLA